jgi:hypothetical protein
MIDLTMLHTHYEQGKAVQSPRTLDEQEWGCVPLLCLRWSLSWRLLKVYGVLMNNIERCGDVEDKHVERGLSFK